MGLFAVKKTRAVSIPPRKLQKQDPQVLSKKREKGTKPWENIKITNFLWCSTRGQEEIGQVAGT